VTWLHLELADQNIPNLFTARNVHFAVLARQWMVNTDHFKVTSESPSAIDLGLIISLSSASLLLQLVHHAHHIASDSLSAALSAL